MDRGQRYRALDGLLQDVLNGTQFPVLTKLLQYWGEPLSGSHRRDPDRQVQSPPGNRGGLLDLVGGQVGGGQPGQVKRLVSGMVVVVLSQGSGQYGHRPQGTAQLGPAAAGHDVQLGRVDPGRPVPLGLAFLPVVQGGAGGIQSPLDLVRLVGHGAGPRHPLVQQSAHARRRARCDGGAAPRRDLDREIPVRRLVGEEGESVAEEVGVVGLAGRVLTLLVQALGLRLPSSVECRPPGLLGLLGEKGPSAATGFRRENGVPQQSLRGLVLAEIDAVGVATAEDLVEPT